MLNYILWLFCQQQGFVSPFLRLAAGSQLKQPLSFMQIICDDVTNLQMCVARHIVTFGAMLATFIGIELVYCMLLSIARPLVLLLAPADRTVAPGWYFTKVGLFITRG